MKTILIGHSGAGKSSLHFKLLESGIVSVEMDVELGTDKCPDFEHAMLWMQRGNHEVATLGVHRDLIDRMAWEKERQYCSGLFDGLNLIYLSHGIDKIEHSVHLLTPRGKVRPPSNVESTIRTHDVLVSPLSAMSDYTIDCTNKDLDQVFKEVLEHVKE